MKRLLICVALLGASRAPILQPPPPVPTISPVYPELSITFGQIEAAARAQAFSGHLLLILRSGDFERDLPEDSGVGDTAMWRFASVTKQIVAVAVMQQVEAGTLALDAPVARYDPQIGIANADRVTIRQLLQHTSGISNPEDGPKDADGILLRYARKRPATIKEAREGGPAYIRDLMGNRQGVVVVPISSSCKGPATSAPGARFSYNNCDYDALGRVLEVVTN